MFKQIKQVKQILALTLTLVLCAGLAAPAMAVGMQNPPEWRQLYFNEIRSVADYASKYDVAAPIYGEYDETAYNCGNILDIALADLNFDGTPELLIAQSIPAGAGNTGVVISTVSNGVVTKLSSYEAWADANRFPELTAANSGELAYTVLGIIYDENSDPDHGIQYLDIRYLFTLATKMDKNIVTNAKVNASILANYKPTQYKQATIGRSMTGIIKMGIEGDVYTDEEIWAFLDSYVPEITPTITATPTNTKFMLNGAEVSLPAYLIDGSNYVKLRDVGQLLATRFDVRWADDKAKLYDHEKYTSTGDELATVAQGSQTATPSNTDFVWGDSGESVSGLTAYLVGGNNYINLRDIAKLFDFDVDWRDGKAWIEP